jgi:hypothetical protein
MIKIGEMLRSGFEKAPAFAVIGALIGAAIATALPLLALPGLTAAFGMGPIVAFGLVGALGGASTGAALAAGVGAAESFDQQRETAGSQQSRGDYEVSADQYVAPSQSFRERSNRSVNQTESSKGR